MTPDNLPPKNEVLKTTENQEKITPINIENAVKKEVHETKDTAFTFEEYDIKKEYEQLKINKLKDKIESLDIKNQNLENMGLIEKEVRLAIDGLVSAAKNEKQKIEFNSILDKLNETVDKIKSNRVVFAEKLKMEPSIENFKKYKESGGYWKDIKKIHTAGWQPFHSQVVGDIGFEIGYLENPTFPGVSLESFEKAIKYFGMKDFNNVKDLYNIYNKKHKSFFKKGVKPGKEHDFYLPTNVEGILVHVKHRTGDHVSIELSQDFISEIFSKDL